MGRLVGSGDQADLIYGLHAIREALRAHARPLLRLLVLRTDRQFAELVRAARLANVPIHVEPQQALDRLVPGGRHQGVVAVIASKPYAATGEILAHARDRGEAPFLVILDGVEDPQNLGAICRSAEAAGVHGVLIPERRSAGLTGAVARASAGALEHLRVGCVTNIARLIESLKEHGIWIYGVDPSGHKPYTALDYQGPVALVLGGEGRGIRPNVLDKCDDRARIPMAGQVASLNVSAAAAVVLFEAVRQRTAGSAARVKAT
jgi:23S rRNA (guanosine2251-2'-O)-methyltransferase